MCVFLALRCLALTFQIRRQVETRADGHQAHICTLDFLPNSRTGDLPFGATSSLAGSKIQPSKTIPGWLCLSPAARKRTRGQTRKRVRPKLYARSARKRFGWHAVAWMRGREHEGLAKPGKGIGRTVQPEQRFEVFEAKEGAQIGFLHAGTPSPDGHGPRTPVGPVWALGRGFRLRSPSHEGIATWRCSGCHRGAEVNGKSGDERNKYF